MVKKLSLGLFSLLAILSLFSACNTDPSTTTQAAIAVQSSAVSTTSSTTNANWWDKFGTPQYGGEFTYATTGLDANFDTLSFIGLKNELWFQAPLFLPDWTLDRSIWDVGGSFVPDQYFTGNIAESWEMTDPQTFTVNIRKGVTWQNKAPVNGREFTAYDIQSHFVRQMDTDSGSMFTGMLSSWESVTATNNYTVVFKFKTPCGGVALQSVQDLANVFEAPESVEAEGGKLTDWTKAVGAGPWMLDNFVAGSSMNFIKNPNYWGYDPRYPQNKVPYADALNLIVIPDVSTQIASLRTAKIDLIIGLEWQQAKSLSSSNPELQTAQGAAGIGGGLIFRLDKAPFTDINVRKAMNMAIDRQTIAKGLYAGKTDGSPTGWFSQSYTGYSYAYADWPQTLKDEYTYNPTAAKKLLADAGYPNGFTTNVVSNSVVQPGGFATSLELLETFKYYFNEIGIDMEIKTMDSAVLETYLRDGKHDQMTSQPGGALWAPTRAFDQWYSKGSDAGKSMVNDSVYDELRTEFWASTIAEEAAKICVEADKRVIEQYWGVWIVVPGTYNFWQLYVKGYSSESNIDSSSIIWARMWIDQSSKK